MDVNSCWMNDKMDVWVNRTIIANWKLESQWFTCERQNETIPDVLAKMSSAF